MTAEQRERLKEAMGMYKIYLEHGVAQWGSSHINLVNGIRAELGMPVHSTNTCGRCIPNLVFKDVYRLYNEQTDNI